MILTTIFILCDFFSYWPISLFRSKYLIFADMTDTQPIQTVFKLVWNTSVFVPIELQCDIYLLYQPIRYGINYLGLCWNLCLCSWICAIEFLILCLCLSLGLCSWACAFMFLSLCFCVPWMDLVLVLGWFHWRKWDFMGLCSCILEHVVFDFIFFGFVFVFFFFNLVLYFLI